MPSADPASGRSSGQAPGGGPARGPLALVLAAAAVFVAGFVKGAIGFGFPTLGTPLLALVVDVKTAVPLLIVPNLVQDGIQFRRQGPVGGSSSRLVLLLVFTIVGTIIGTKLLVMLSPRAAALTLGVFLLGYVTLDLARVTPRIPRGWELRLAPPVGLVAGVMGGITNAPGTMLALYFVALGMEKREFVRSISLTFLVVKGVQLVTLTWYGLFGRHLVLGTLGLTVVSLGGFALGVRLQDRLDQRAFNRAVLIFLAILGVWLVARAL